MNRGRVYHYYNFSVMMNHNMTTPDSLTDPESDTYLDDTTFFILQLLFMIIFCFISGLFGTVTNIINIIVFVRQGLFSGGSTINLFFLAVADVGVAFTIFLHSIGFSVILADLQHLSWDPWPFVYLLLGWPHTVFIKITRIITAYVAFERCMCVVIPFRVQTLFTPRRSLVYILIIFAYGFISHLPIYLTHGINYEMQENTNKTKLVLTYGPNRELWHAIVYYTNFFVVSFLSVIVVLVCTVITSTHVRMSKKWRSNVSKTSKTVATNQPQAQPMDDRETRLVKMITAISIIFLICYIPDLTYIVVRSVDERIRTNREYYRLAFIIYAVGFNTATINSSINIFVYYSMSTKYKKVFHTYFGRNKDASSVE